MSVNGTWAQSGRPFAPNCSVRYRLDSERYPLGEIQISWTPTKWSSADSAATGTNDLSQRARYVYDIPTPPNSRSGSARFLPLHISLRSARLPVQRERLQRALLRAP